MYRQTKQAQNQKSKEHADLFASSTAAFIAVLQW